MVGLFVNRLVVRLICRSVCVARRAWRAQVLEAWLVDVKRRVPEEDTAEHDYETKYAVTCHEHKLVSPAVAVAAAARTL